MFVDECPFAKDTSNIICETAPSKDVIEAAMLTMVSLGVQVVCCMALSGHKSS
jgi:hypothetical protein